MDARAARGVEAPRRLPKAMRLLPSLGHDAENGSNSGSKYYVNRAQNYVQVV